jgi:hypothetical protein
LPAAPKTFTADAAAATTNADKTGNGLWWINGDGRYDGGTKRPVPAGSNTATIKPNGVNDIAYGAAKAMATGYTCAQEGCHVNSHFAVNTWGYAEEHEVRGTNPAVEAAITGHGTGAWGHAGGQPSCAPCHPGGASGGYRINTDGKWGDPDAGLSPRTAMAFGCDQCHDMVGKATDSTAWPHGNRDIDVYEWSRPGGIPNPLSKTTKTLRTGSRNNLWMYAHSIGVPATEVGTQWEGNYDMTFETAMGPDGAFGGGDDNPTPGEEAEANANGSRYLVSTGGNEAYWQGDFSVIEDGIEQSASNPGVVNDAICLKCHIPIDTASKAAANNGGDPLPLNPGGASSHHHYFINKDGKPATIPEEGNSWKVGTEETEGHYTGHAQLIYLFK